MPDRAERSNIPIVCGNMNKIKENNKKAERRAVRIRAKLFGTASRPRLSVFRSNRFTYAQAVDDKSGRTLLSASTREISEGKNKSEKAFALGTVLAQKAKEAGIEAMVFDKGSYKYHGRIKNLAESLRKSGINI